MDIKKKIPLEQVEAARQALAALPDLSQDRMSKGQLLHALSDRLHTLKTEKGYSQIAIQEQLRKFGIRTSPVRIAQLVAEFSKRSKARKTGSRRSR